MVSFSIILIGFTAMAAQIVLAREFLVVFYGNELTISIILASWLCGGAAGSYFLGRLADRIKNSLTVFALCQAVLAILLPPSILAIRSIKIALNINPGEIVGFFPVLASSFIILAPVCVILGFMFTLACRVFDRRGCDGADRISLVYVLEAVGSAAGGIIASFFLIRMLNSEYIMTMLSLINVLASLTLLILSGKSRLRVVSLAIVGAVLLTGLAMWFTGGWEQLNRYSIKQQWRGFELIASKNSIYGNVAVTKKADQFSFFANGLHIYTVPDILRQEEAVHFALLEHPDPLDVLLIGGGAGGLVGEIVKHPVRSVDYIEIDPLIIEMARSHLPTDYYQALDDRRVAVMNLDGRLYINRTDKKYDCIIINLGNPYTAQLNRFYTLEFFQKAKSIMRKGGVISFSVASSENYISGSLADLLKSLYATLKKVFADVKVLPGNTAFFLASDTEGALTADYDILMARARHRGLALKYVCEYYLFSKLSKERLAYVKNIVKGGRMINYDLRPISFYFDMVFWASRFRDSAFEKILKTVNEKMLWAAVSAVYLFIIAYGLIAPRFRGYRKSAVLAVLAVIGFTGIAFQVIILISFQIIYGYLFYKLGAILTFFMAGLAMGGLVGVFIMRKSMKHVVIFVLAQLACGVYIVALPAIFSVLADTKSAAASWIGANIVFNILPAIAGIIGGFQFSLANKLYQIKEKKMGGSAAITYGTDLIGSCLAALLIAVFLVPLLGIAKTCLVTALLNFAISISLTRLLKKDIVL